MRRFPMRYISYAGIIILWIVIMAGLAGREFRPHKTGLPVSPRGTLPEELFQEQWLGIYYRNEKVGYASRNIEKKENGYSLFEFMKMQLIVMGLQKDIETRTEANLDTDLRLTSFNVLLKADVPMHIRGRVQGDVLSVSVDTLGAISERDIPLKGNPSLNLSIIPNILKEGITEGRKFSLTVIDPASLSQERVTVEVAGNENITALGKKQEAFKIKGSLRGMDFYIWINGKGEVLKEESQLGFTFVRETKENAVRVGKPSLDLIAQVAVPVKEILPPETSYLRIRLSGIDHSVFEMNGGRQRLHGELLEITKEFPLSGIDSDAKDVSGGYLENTLFVQSQDPEIIALSGKILNGERERLKAALLLHDWIFSNIEKVPEISIPTASEVLRTRRGDCNEHTILFTALARAAGIPTRIALGLTYRDEYFYYHAWPEIFVDRWIAIDPTLGQFPADASHIRLITGDLDKQAQLLSVIGKIQIEVLEYR